MWRLVSSYRSVPPLSTARWVAAVMSTSAEYGPGLRTLATGTRAELLTQLREIHQRVGGHLETSPQAQRLWLARASAPYPAVEHYLSIGVAGVADKQRPAFEQLWDFVTALDLPRQGDLLRDGQP